MMMMMKQRLWTPDICFWPYAFTGAERERVDVKGLCNIAVEYHTAVELVPLAEVPYVRSRGIGITAHLPELANGKPPFSIGLCNSEDDYQNVVLPAYRSCMKVAAAGEKMIVFTGLVENPSPSDRDVCINRLKDDLAPEAEVRGVILVLEHLNDKGDSPDDMKGHTDYRGSDLNWVADVVRAVGSPSVRLLFDAYHVEIMHQGQVLELFEKHFDIIGHVHVAGVIDGKPSRVELDTERQEIPYYEFSELLTELGWDGGVGLEYVLTPERGLQKGLEGSIGELM